MAADTDPARCTWSMGRCERVAVARVELRPATLVYVRDEVCAEHLQALLPLGYEIVDRLDQAPRDS